MAGKDFSDLGRVEALRALYEGTPFEAFGQNRFEAAGREYVAYASKVMLEGIDFDLVYFPLKHLGHHRPRQHVRCQGVLQGGRKA